MLQTQLAQAVLWECRAREPPCVGESRKQGPQGTPGSVPHTGGAGTWGGTSHVEHSGLGSWAFGLCVLCCALLMASAVLFKTVAGVGLEGVHGLGWVCAGACTTTSPAWSQAGRCHPTAEAPRPHCAGGLSPVALQPQAPGLQLSMQRLLAHFLT